MLLAYTGACILVDTQQRYLVPMLPIVAAFAAVPVWAVASRLLRRVWRLWHPSAQLRSAG
jgi:hypothetical protein